MILFIGHWLALLLHIGMSGLSARMAQVFWHEIDKDDAVILIGAALVFALMAVLDIVTLWGLR